MTSPRSSSSPGSRGAVARKADGLHQIVAAKNRVDGALGGNTKTTVELAHQKLADFAGAPVRFFPFAGGDEAFDLRGQWLA